MAGLKAVQVSLHVYTWEGNAEYIAWTWSGVWARSWSLGRRGVYANINWYSKQPNKSLKSKKRNCVKVCLESLKSVTWTAFIKCRQTMAAEWVRRCYKIRSFTACAWGGGHFLQGSPCAAALCTSDENSAGTAPVVPQRWYRSAGTAAVLGLLLSSACTAPGLALPPSPEHTPQGGWGGQRAGRGRNRHSWPKLMLRTIWCHAQQ